MSNQPYSGYTDIITYLDNNDLSNWSFSDFLCSNFDTILNSSPVANDINTLNGTWWKRFTFEVEAKGHKAVKVNMLQFVNFVRKAPPVMSLPDGHLLEIQNFFYNVISTRLEITRQQNIAILKSETKIIADKQGVGLVRASCRFHGSEMITEYSLNQSDPKRDLDEDIGSDLFSKKPRRMDDYTTPPNRIRNSSPQPYNEESSSSESEIIPISLTNVFYEEQQQESCGCEFKSGFKLQGSLGLSIWISEKLASAQS
ncbi:11895_t:CDS:2, partial [Funneliformis geosporum]